MKKKVIIFIGFFLLLAMSLIGAYFGYKYYKNKQNYDEGYEEYYDEEAGWATYNESKRVFVGDDGYLIKGKLLNLKYQKEYDKLPDTLYKLRFKDEIFPIDIGEVGKRYSVIEGNLEEDLRNVLQAEEQKNLLSYLLLAIQGNVEYPEFYSPEGIYDCLIGPIDFSDIYKDNFSGSYNQTGIEEIPYSIKEYLIEFYNSEEGRDYRYTLTGTQTSYDLIWEGCLSGKNKKEYAILLKNTEEKLSDYYYLLVFASKNYEYESNRKYYLVYSERFYDKVLMDHIETSIEGEIEFKPIYRNSIEPENVNFDGIILKQINRHDEVLVYDSEFDKMIKYTQVSSSQLRPDDAEEEY